MPCHGKIKTRHTGFPSYHHHQPTSPFFSSRSRQDYQYTLSSLSPNPKMRSFAYIFICLVLNMSTHANPVPIVKLNVSPAHSEPRMISLRHADPTPQTHAPTPETTMAMSPPVTSGVGRDPSKPDRRNIHELPLSNIMSSNPSVHPRSEHMLPHHLPSASRHDVASLEKRQIRNADYSSNSPSSPPPASGSSDPNAPGQKSDEGAASSSSPASSDTSASSPSKDKRDGGGMGTHLKREEIPLRYESSGRVTSGECMSTGRLASWKGGRLGGTFREFFVLLGVSVRVKGRKMHV